MAFTVSVVIPAYNAEKHIGRAIDSVLNQRRPANEIIVVDDGSTDRTADVVKGYGDKVRCIYQDNLGVSVARNTAIEAATGEWIAFLDADDEWLAGKLEAQVKHLQKNPELKWTYSNYYLHRPGSNELVAAHQSESLIELLGGKDYFEDYLSAYVNNGHAWTCCLMIERDVFDKVGVFEPGMKRAQDNDLWYRIAYQYPRIGYIAEPLAIYHLDTPGSSTKINDDVDFMVELIDRHVGLAAGFGRVDSFKLCATYSVKVWIQQLLTQRRFDDIRLLLRKFGELLPDRFRREARFRLIWPPVTNCIGDIVMKLKKAFNKK